MFKRKVYDKLVEWKNESKGKISMYPMDYKEFLWAIGEHTTTPLIRQCFESRKAVGEQLNLRYRSRHP